MKPTYVQLLFDEKETRLLDKLRGETPRATFIKARLVHSLTTLLKKKGEKNVEKE